MELEAIIKFKTKKVSMDIIGFYVINGGTGDMAKYVRLVLSIATG